MLSYLKALGSATSRGQRDTVVSRIINFPRISDDKIYYVWIVLNISTDV